MAINLRSIVKLNKCALRYISLSSTNMEEAMERLQKNPYFDKYAERIAQLQKTSPAEFLERVEGAARAADEQRRRKFAAAPDTSQYSSVLNPKQPLGDEASAEDKKLETIFKVELVKDKNASDIQNIWEEYHKNKEVISATIQYDVYKVLKKTMQQYPTFLFPLPRSQGYEFIMSQCHGDTVHFTPLLAYQVHKENAPECLTMVHYTELAGDKGLVLMRGDYDKNVLSGKEAQCLANQFQMYYNNKDSNKSHLLQVFTEHPDTFKHVDLISELENLNIV